MLPQNNFDPHDRNHHRLKFWTESLNTSTHDFLDRGVIVPHTNVQQVDIRRAKLLQAVFHRRAHRLDIVSYKFDFLLCNIISVLVSQRILRSEEDDLISDPRFLYPLSDYLLALLGLTILCGAVLPILNARSSFV